MNQKEREFNELFSGLEPEQPSMRFTKNVMDNIEGLQVASVTKHRVNSWVVKSIAAMLLAVIAVLSAYIFMNAGEQTDYTAGFNSAFHTEFLHTIKDNYAAYVIFANAILLLILIERLITRKRRMNYLQRMN